jgi:hypothetical protein
LLGFYLAWESFLLGRDKCPGRLTVCMFLPVGAIGPCCRPDPVGGPTNCKQMDIGRAVHTQTATHYYELHYSMTPCSWRMLVWCLPRKDLDYRGDVDDVDMEARVYSVGIGDTTNRPSVQ